MFRQAAKKNEKWFMMNENAMRQGLWLKIFIKI
jgi:hypothetical protein